ncbi:fructosamine kinase family protein [Chamaesiphon sp. VAR_48_metabat_403]|uniref:fructosamine kinase family protein n=1 Tax=Chamaesiphon sp. VAR_48_metabat_403 TaxID=2964700 RepID=UPI00286E0D9B|nr:fructosamine kinase family protein [Chamaesiphon sp. VAR_48_metabat_403]
MWKNIGAQITRATGTQFEIVDCQSIGGGCINQVYRISNDPRSPSNRQDYLLKLNRASLIEMFVAEAAGLSELGATATIKVPTPICWGIAGEYSYLVLEYLDLTTTANSQNWAEMGSNLAAMHRSLEKVLDLGKPQERTFRFRQIDGVKFGWHTHNTIGSTAQLNTWETDWATFFADRRIGYQLQLAQAKGGVFPQAAALLQAIPHILADRQPQPSLVHGDLWGGNASFTTAGIPVIFDPATYWGDREVDLAMTELFGGFPVDFYQGYERVYPLAPGYSQRKDLYNLYHILNHYNLFGGSYRSQANTTIDRLLRDFPGS